MMPLRVLLIDDEPLALSRLASLFAQLPDCEIVGTADDGRAALAAIAEFAPDVVMLDIQMPEMSGLSVALDLPQDNRPEIVFVTAFEQFAPDAFEVDATDYLLKPVRFDRLRQAIERARHRRMLRARPPVSEAATVDDAAIWVQMKDGLRRVSIGAIEWIEAARDYVMLHTRERSFIYRSTMAGIEARLEGSALMRIHRSAFVRVDLVDQIVTEVNDGLSVVLRGGAKVRVGPNYAQTLLQRLAV